MSTSVEKIEEPDLKSPPPDNAAGTSSIMEEEEEEEEVAALRHDTTTTIRTTPPPPPSHPPPQPIRSSSPLAPTESPSQTIVEVVATTAAAAKETTTTTSSTTTATTTTASVTVMTTTMMTTTAISSAITTSTTTTTSLSRNNRRRSPHPSGVGGGGTGGGGGGGLTVGGGGGGVPPPPSPGSNGHNPNRGFARTCCLCWCCCCNCSKKDARCLSVRNNEEKSARARETNKLEILNGENEPPPTLEDIRAWGESFDRLMRCSAGRKVFRDFLRCEYSEENILFWLACEELKRETNAESVEEKARLIYEDYISILSPKEVSLDSRVREVINRNMVEPSPHTFDEAQLQIYTLMHRDSYPRFVNSPIYKKLAQVNTSSRKESSA